MATLVLLLTSTGTGFIARRVSFTKNGREQRAKVSFITVQDTQHEFGVAIGTVFVLWAGPTLCSCCIVDELAFEKYRHFVKKSKKPDRIVLFP
jgi:hypothetical protein